MVLEETSGKEFVNKFAPCPVILRPCAGSLICLSVLPFHDGSGRLTLHVTNKQHLSHRYSELDVILISNKFVLTQLGLSGLCVFFVATFDN